MMQYYELIYIIPVKFAGKEFEKIQNKVKEIIQKDGGQIVFEENLGKKKLSYAIKHNTQGFYIINEFDIESDKIKSVNEKIKLTPEVIRHLIFKKKKLTEEDRKKEKEKKERKEKREDKKTTMTDQFDIERQLEDSGPKPEAIEEVEKQQEEPKEEQNIETQKHENTKTRKQENKIKLEDLDEKLDTIINDNLL
ncbi:MAG: 30S ribosomal protein S6 [bacterium]